MKDNQFDKFGGLKIVLSRGTGFFRVEKVGRRWWFITPEGHGFLSLGVNHIDSSALKYSDNLHAWREKYGDEETFLKKAVHRDLTEWGFNTVGWAQEVVVRGRTHTPIWRHDQYHWAGLPYCHLLPFTEIEMWNNYPRFPDVFSAEFEEWCDYTARASCADMADDPYLIGYFYSDVPAWGAHRTGLHWAGRLDLGKPEGQAELKRLAARYYQVIHDAIRRYDKNHLLLGDRYNGQALLPEIVLEAMAPTVDVLSIQHFPPLDPFLEKMPRWHEITGKPVINADCAFPMRTGGRVHAGGVAMQAERGRLYAEWAEKCFRLPFFIGWHWCAYIENTCRCAGLKDRFDQPYGDAIRPMHAFNKRVYEVAGQ